MDYKLSKIQSDELFSKLKKDYLILAPKVFKGEGRYSDLDSIRYGEVSSFEEIEFERKSHYSAKEVLLPINHITEVKYNGQSMKINNDSKKRLIVLRSCDIHALKRIDNKFLNDEYYRARRENVKFMVMECSKSFDTCFCVTMGTNQTEDYSLGIRFLDDGILIKNKDDDFNKYFDDDIPKYKFDINFVKENEVNVNIPDIKEWDRETLLQAKSLSLWDEYKKRCIGCGSCNMSCPTCTCLTTNEIKNENTGVTEIRRIWSGCQLVKSASFKDGKKISDIVPKRISQRVFDKFYMPKLKTSNEQICVGCGRCTDNCPRLISFSTTVNRFSQELDKIYVEEGLK
ncbi:anaerobic sulfite reductase subunit A [Sarcina ventriculi]|uniref:4Fe-4S dicluster domain-containing protein n=1 Tax=Sarcina ventriculi TaxID=1267 RepID=UPI000D9E0DB4|nr:4Fe-4S dicluster domain-containing protein [Sarcina ventriculi]SPZ48885.1 anaerobic sulfite reductase subunit A [Sarcina ventriculi]